MKTRAIAIAALTLAGLCWVASASRAADRWVPDDGKCGERENTMAIEDCIGARTKMWDGRLNQAWHTLQDFLRSDADLAKRMPSLKAAQLAWLKYRDANCAYYGTAGGTIWRIESANCMLNMTQARAIELQQEGPH